MNFKLFKASDLSFNKDVVIYALDDLEALSAVYNNAQLIVDFHESTIWIYDDYME